MTSALAPVYVDAPIVPPAPFGLLNATQWLPVEGPLRWLDSGMELKVFNFGGDSQFGVWVDDYCAGEADVAAADSIVEGDRPASPDEFLAVTTWARDDCDLTKRSQEEVRTRATQVHALQEPLAVEAAFAERLLGDAPSPESVASVLEAVSHLEAELAKTSTLGFIHAGAQHAASAAQANLIVRSGSVLKTPLGHTWVFGGGYVDGLDTTLVASSQPIGQRGEVDVRPVQKLEWNRFAVIVQRSLVIGYEAVVAAAEIEVEEP